MEKAQNTQVGKYDFIQAGGLNRIVPTKDGLHKASGKLVIKDKEAREQIAHAILAGADLKLYATEWKSKYTNEGTTNTYFSLSIATSK
jgi:hypothetical protein